MKPLRPVALQKTASVIMVMPPKSWLDAPKSGQILRYPPKVSAQPTIKVRMVANQVLVTTPIAPVRPVSDEAASPVLRKNS